MENVFDIRYERQLTYILVPDTVNDLQVDEIKKISAAVVLYLYYEDTLQTYYKYIDNIPESVDIYFISSNQKVLEILKREYAGRNATYLVKENVGRDISALLITCKKVVNKYEYVCFLHDKKAKKPVTEEEVDLWIENLWGNLLGSDNYIYQVLSLFEQNHNIGVLAPPDPIGDHFGAWYGGGWEKSFDVTEDLIRRLQLTVDISEEKPPVSLGTAFWFRTTAVKKIFDYSWSYDDFDDKELVNSNYISYAVERIFPYVAQDAGYDTGEVMNVQYAAKQMSYLKHSIPLVFADQIRESPMLKLSDKLKEKERLSLLTDFCKNTDALYLYGVGKMGKYVYQKLTQANIKVAGFLQTQRSEVDIMYNLPIYVAESLVKQNPNIGVVVTAYQKDIREEMLKVLESHGVKRIHMFWGD